MKKITFKLFALMLACFLVLPLMFACGEQGGSSEGTEASQSTSTTALSYSLSPSSPYGKLGSVIPVTAQNNPQWLNRHSLWCFPKRT